MDMNLVVIFTFILLAASLVFTMAHRFHQRTVDHEERKLELKARIAEAKAQEGGHQQDAMQMLEDRMRVVERIVTDPSTDLSRQIEDLRASETARKEAAS